MKSYTYTELDMLAGEVLPERSVLSTLLMGGGGDGTTAVVPNCQSNIVNPTGGGGGGGLLGALGLGSNSGYSSHTTASFTCASSTVVSGH